MTQVHETAGTGVRHADSVDAVALTQRTYTVIAADYAGHQNRGDGDWLSTHLGRMAEELGPGARVADIGCGPGHQTRLLREKGLRAYGFDLSYDMLGALEIPGMVQADMRALPIATGGLDAVWCSAALLHIPRAMVPGVLAEFRRVLRPEGLLGLTIAEGEGEGWEQVPYREDEQRRYFVYHSAEAITTALEGAGFRIFGQIRTSTHRNWLTLHAGRNSGVH
ncbi:class I SAM-dependent methyltransferase [Actinospica durhamensis]|uniref:Class I SAM-dependent methyltransferase n=1 Tax=Actinospica durhamensis TaxID=1508375 RepID=A0A941EQV6_9ACTN|nr:class I SAM-dependent methyltransferase [Actinospica durhamensis]MBR7835493.1 class I SAM-dependent methyltransferase [Actinospica durhamensis]